MFVRMRTRTPIVPGRPKSVDIGSIATIPEPVDERADTLFRRRDEAEVLGRLDCSVLRYRGPGNGQPRRARFRRRWHGSAASRAVVPAVESGRTGRRRCAGRSRRPRDPMTTARPTRSKLPTVVSLLAIVLVAAVVGAASLVARYADTHVALAGHLRRTRPGGESR